MSRRRSLHGGGEGRPNANARGYGSAWRKRAAAHLERVRQRQEAEGWPGGPWCECGECEADRVTCEILTGKGASGVNGMMIVSAQHGLSWMPPLRAETVDHRHPRRLFPLELQGSDAPGGSDHPDNLRAMAHGHHSRRRDDKVRRRE